MTYSSLHRALDAPSGPVTAEMVAEAVELHLVENEDLDWKQDTEDLKDNREVAKDFAAMANTTGGLIIVGVTEDGNDRAKDLTGLDAARARNIVRQFRETASSRIRPFIPALQVYSLQTTHDSDRYIVVVDVPRSQEAPHLVTWDKESMRYPRRLGTDTVWLGESDLEAAYGGRFRRRHESAARLGHLAAELRTHLQDAPNRVWLIVTATCSMPALEDAGPGLDPDNQDPHLRTIYEGLPLRGSLLRQNLKSFTPRMGYRRAVFSSPGLYQGTSSRAHLELHLDGTFASGLSDTSTTEHPGSRLLTQLALEGGIRDLIVTATRHASNRGAGGTLQILADLHSPHAITLAERDSPQDEPLDASIMLPQTVPVYAEGPLAHLASDPGKLAELTKRMLLDLTHQFAVPVLVTL